MKRIILPLLLLLFAFSPLAAEKNRRSSAPYISGDSFRFTADHHYDELCSTINFNAVKSGDTIFVKTDYLKNFFEKIHTQIPVHYILITHNSDFPVPGNFASYLEDQKILAWFGQNTENYIHPKLHPIPIGIANRCWKHGNIATFALVQKKLGHEERNKLLYMNFSIGTYYKERKFVADLFQKKSFCIIGKPKGHSPYLLDLVKSKFVLSPRGNGLDCHRTWEALLMGAIPIVKASTMDKAFEDLPVLIVDDWSIINRNYLNKKYQEMKSKTYNLDKLTIDYWLKEIEKVRKDHLQQ